ncbi:hypothetical protein OHB26_39485 (plasmid) [Nocardia sp. NBC_01503]|uniref:hypothetical protein n=1 Tax=Nocardia sp. NBC_01503 TaxID=2975997 RepID=UPI002E7B9F18|nr:hypothetical protein [Nocardia sp. NBC_01503]WTL36685.1 hypothetical protein OHB26_39090 [Nocardia sp. NBC_01503]WTL36762.1 hypothetical protein OHB26_39485 [Nocardia sp. NBC_01503]
MRVHAAHAVELERERNRGTVAAIAALPTGGLLVEHEHGGRSRMIAVPAPAAMFPAALTLDPVQPSAITGSAAPDYTHERAR